MNFVAYHQMGRELLSNETQEIQISVTLEESTTVFWHRMRWWHIREDSTPDLTALPGPRKWIFAGS
jgi:hypothetical protein